MNDDKTLFAEMLGMGKPQQPSGAAGMTAEADGGTQAEEVFDELDVQRQVVEDMAREKAEREELRASLESAKQSLEAEKVALETEKKELQDAKAALEAANRDLERRVAEREEEKSDRIGSADELKALNAALEAKVTRLGKALMAARRAAAEAAKVEIGGRRW